MVYWNVKNMSSIITIVLSKSSKGGYCSEPKSERAEASF